MACEKRQLHFWVAGQMKLYLQVWGSFKGIKVMGFYAFSCQDKLNRLRNHKSSSYKKVTQLWYVKNSRVVFDTDQLLDT